MSIIREYTANYIKANKKNRLPLFLSIMISVVLINAYVFFIYSVFIDELIRIKKFMSWDGQSYAVPISKVPIVEQNQHVKSVALQQLSLTGKGDSVAGFVLMESGDVRFWQTIENKQMLLSGRFPERDNEIIFNKMFFKQNPQYKIGDEIEFKLGERFYNGEEILASDNFISGETFVQKSKRVFKITGIFSEMPGVPASAVCGMYCFNPEKLNPDETVCINIYLNSKINAYKKLFDISENLGFQKNKDGTYKIFINESLLSFYGIKNPQSKGLSYLQKSILKSLCGLIILASFFIYLIYNVFEVWSNKRIKQIGMLKSIGVSKLQVFESIMLESIYIGALPILCGSLIGLIFNKMLFASINKYSTRDGVYFPQYHFGVIPFIAVIVFSFITVLIASLIPARRLSKMNIIDSLKGNIEKTKSFKKRILKNNDWKGEMRKNNFRTFRGTSNAIFISYILLFALLTMITIYVVEGDFNYYRSSDEIKVTYCLVDNDDQFDCSAKAVFKPLTELREISSFYYYLNFEAWFKCSDKMLSDTFKKESWFELKHNGRYFLNLNPEERRLTLEIYGIDDVNFKKLLEAEGEDVNSYYQKNSYKAILVNKIQKDLRIPYRNSEFIPFLNSDITKIDCYLSNKLTGDKTEIKIGKLIFDTDKIETKIPVYSVLLLMPIEKAQALRKAQIKYDKENNEFFQDGEVYRFCLRTDEKNVLQLRNEIDEIIKPQLRGRNEYWTTDIIQEKVFAEIGAHFLNTVFLSFMLLVLFAGCINSYSTIKTNLNMRRREFAILRSVGADGKTIEGIFFDEAKYFIISPLLKALPVCVIIAALVILRFDIIFVGNFIAHFNWLFFFFYVLCLACTVLVLYLSAIKEIKTAGMIENLY